MSEQDTLHVKMDKDDVVKFRKAAKKYERTAHDVLKELIIAFHEQRLTITPTRSQTKQQEELYNESRKSS